MSLYDISGGKIHQVGEVSEVPPEIKLDADQINKMGYQYFMAGDLANAEKCFISIVNGDPKHAMAWSNLGLIWQMHGHFDDALKCYMTALAIDPNMAGPLSNLGYINEKMGFYDHAMRLYERALQVAPEHPRTRVNIGYILLRRHEYQRGWTYLESRFECEPRITFWRDAYKQREWDGLPCQRLAVWPEQGVGDQLVYATLLRELERIGQPFTCEIDARLIPGLERAWKGDGGKLPWGARFVPSSDSPHNVYDVEAMKDCDAHVSMMSLAKFFRNSFDEFPRKIARILQPDMTRANYLREKLPVATKRVAISWRSFHNQLGIAKQNEKSAYLADFEVLGRRSDLSLATVQYGDVAGELDAWEGSHIYRPDFDLYKDIDGVLAMIGACDVVVTTSNVTAHFAGAMGVPCYLIYLRAHPPFFYWSPAHDGKSLWYPSVEVVTGEAISTWKDVIALVNERI